MTGFDLGKDALEHVSRGNKANFQRKKGKPFVPLLGAARRARSGPGRRSFGLPGRSAFFRLLRRRGPRSAAPLSIDRVGAVALARPSVFFPGKIGVTVFVRRFLDPGGQKFQIEKIRRGLLLGHESLYAMAGGCKIGGAIWRPNGVKKSKIN